MKAKPAQQFPQKKCSLLIPPDSRQAVTNRVIRMPQTEYLDNSVLSPRSHSVPLSWLSVSLEFRKRTYSYYHCKLNTCTYHLTPTAENANDNTLYFIQNVPGKIVKVVCDPGLSLNTKSQISFLVTLALRQVPAIKDCGHDESACEHAFKNFQIFILPWLLEDFWLHLKTHKTIKQIWAKPTAAYIWWQS